MTKVKTVFLSKFVSIEYFLISVIALNGAEYLRWMKTTLDKDENKDKNIDGG